MGPNDIDLPEATSLMHLLEHVPVLSGIGMHELRLVASKCRLIHAPEDEIIIEQNDLSNDLYIIITGKVLVTKKTKANQWVKVNTLAAGDYFGEIALLKHVPRTARVTTLSHCTFVTINGGDFLKLYEYFPAHSRDNIQLVIAKRLAQLSHIV